MITAKQLAERHNVSVRTIYRDIRTLEKSGIPVVTEEGKGYSLMEGYHLPPVLFTEDEANALITVEQLVIKNKDQSFSENVSSAIEKIKSILRYSQKGNADLLADRIYFGGNQKEEKSSNNLMQIQSAIIHFQVLSSVQYTAQINFGNPPFTIASGNADGNGLGNFEYAVPSGYYALCTKNINQYG